MLLHRLVAQVAEVIDARLRQLRSGDAKPVTEAHCLLDIMINDSYVLL